MFGSLLAVQNYFTKSRALVFGIIASGSSIGTFAFGFMWALVQMSSFYQWGLMSMRGRWWTPFLHGCQWDYFIFKISTILKSIERILGILNEKMFIISPQTIAYTAGYFRPFLDNKPAFHNLSIIYRIKPLPYRIIQFHNVLTNTIYKLYANYGRQVYYVKIGE